FGIEVEPPDFRSLESHFHTNRKVVRFGLSDIKGVGEAQVTKMDAAVTEAKDLLANREPGEWTWFEFLLFCSNSLSTTVVTRIIEVGALRWFKMQRQRMLAEYNAWCSLTEKEQEWIIELFRVQRGDFIRDELQTLVPQLEQSVKDFRPPDDAP